jgi:hypothetical protein
MNPITDAEWHALADKLRDENTLPPEVRNLVAAIAGAPDPTLTHEACQAQLPLYIAAERQQQDVRARFPAVTQHLRTCTLCEQVYLQEWDVADAGVEPASENLPHLPPPDLSFLPPPAFSEYVAQVAEAVARHAFPRLRQQVVSFTAPFFRRIARIGDEAILHPSATMKHEPIGAMMFLTSTYSAIVTLLPIRDELPWGEDDQLQHALYLQAKAVAQQQGLRDADVESFATTFSMIVGRTPDRLRRLSFP